MNPADFFQGLKPSDYITSAIALAALVVSVLAIAQAHRGVPKPRLEVETWREIPRVYTGGYNEPIDVEPITVTVANHGNGTAHNVQMRVHGTEQSPLQFKLNAIGADETRTFSFNALDVPNGAKRILHLTWWEHPPRRGRKHHAQFRY